MADFQVFPDGVERKTRANLCGKDIAQKLHVAEIPNCFYILNIFPEHPFDFFIMPAPELPRALFGEWFGKTSEAIEHVQGILVKILIQSQLAEDCGAVGFTPRFGQGEGVQPVIMIPPLQGITASPIKVQSRTARNEEFECLFVLVVFSLDR
jgi:hypothetical protein